MKTDDYIRKQDAINVMMDTRAKSRMSRTAAIEAIRGMAPQPVAAIVPCVRCAWYNRVSNEHPAFNYCRKGMQITDPERFFCALGVESMTQRRAGA